jgi:hypothetical protein
MIPFTMRLQKNPSFQEKGVKRPGSAARFSDIDRRIGLSTFYDFSPDFLDFIARYTPPDSVSKMSNDILRIIASKLDPEDYLNLSAVSKKVRAALNSGNCKNFIEVKRGILREMMKKVKKECATIKNFPNAPERVQLAAVKQNGNAIQYIENPSEAVQLEAVKQFGYAIQFIDNPSEDVQLAAVKQNGNAILHIENPSENLQLAAVKQNGLAIEYIKNFEITDKVMILDGLKIRLFKNSSEIMPEAVKLEAVKQNGHSLYYIKNPSEAVQLEAVKKSWRAIQYIKNPCETVKLEAAKQRMRDKDNGILDSDEESDEDF